MNKTLVALGAVGVTGVIVGGVLLNTPTNIPLDTPLTTTAPQPSLPDQPNTPAPVVLESPQSQDFAPGDTAQTDVIDVPAGQNNLTVSLSREDWPDLGQGVLTATVLLDYYDGTDWHMDNVLFKTDGGTRNDEKGIQSDESSWNSDIPPATQIRVKVRSEVDLLSHLTITFK